MSTREIPRNQWVQFFNSFIRKHEDWLVDVRLIGANIGAQTESNELPLEGISADLKDQEDSISITLGKTARQNMTHVIDQVTHVWLKQNDQGADEALEIESKDGTKTLVKFRAPVLPETVDGVTVDEQLHSRKRHKKDNM